MLGRFLRSRIVSVVLAVLLSQLVVEWCRRQESNITYKAFIAQVQADQVAEVEIYINIVHGRLKDGQRFYTLTPLGDNSYMSLLEARGVQIRIERRPRYTLSPCLLRMSLPILLPLGLIGLWRIMRRPRR